MNTFWLKIAAGAFVVVVIAIGLGVVFSGKKSPTPQPQSRVEEKPRTVYDSFARDDKKFAVKPEPEEPNEQAAAASQPEVQQPTTQPATATQHQPQPKFRKLAIEEEVEAQKLFEMAKAQRKMGRLPIMGYKLMVDYCREIIRRWPDCQYAFLSKQMLADIPERYHEMYHITKEELDTSSFYR